MLLGLVWDQTVCKSYQQTTQGDKKLIPSQSQYGPLFTILNEQIIINPDNIIILLKVASSLVPCISFRHLKLMYLELI